jgi:hypothetical protein
MKENDPVAGLISLFEDSFNSGEFIKMTLAKPTGSEHSPMNVFIRPVKIKNQLRLSFVSRYQTRDVTQNLDLKEATSQLRKLLGNDFLHAALFTQNNDAQLLFNKKRKPRLLLGKPTQQSPEVFSHDRIKRRLINPEGVKWLQQLGITDENFRIIPSMQDKFRQINKYIELLDPMFADANTTDEIHIADMGSGKGYLTFGLYHHLAKNLGLNVTVSGIEIREDLVVKCNAIASDSGYENLQFVRGSIAGFHPERLDMLVALHACDTATDDAITAGIRAGARFIVVAPCCHKQVRKAMQPTETLKPALKHGIFAERQAELITDAIRALILEKYGYQTKAVEFISTEHTPKNVMIIGVRKSKNVDKSNISAQIHHLKNLYGIDHHYLETCLEGY